VAIKNFRLPDPGEGLVEADIVTWRVAVGDQIKINDIVVEIETSKSLVELPSPYAGTVHSLLVNEGDTVDVGRPIIAIDDGIGAEPAAADLVPAVPEPEDDSDDVDPVRAEVPGERVAMLVGYGPKTGESKRRPRKAAAVDTGSAEVHDELAAATFATDAPVSRRADNREALQPGAANGGSGAAPLPSPGLSQPAPRTTNAAVLAKPPVRKLAKDLGIDLAALTGSGPGGVITRDDVTSASSPETLSEPSDKTVSVEAPPITVPANDVTRVPIKGVRKATAEAMVQSAFTAPHVSEWVTCDVSATMDLVERLKGRRDFADIKVSPLLLVAKAVCIALAHTPELNANWDSAAQEIVMRRSVNLGIAAATPRGLVVPNIKSAQGMGLADLARAMSNLVTTARAGRTQPAEMSGGTFTITNIGVFGVDAGTPILNPGESCILCLGQITRRPWVVGTGADERIEPRWVTTLAVSFDHRMADGAQGSTFLADVAAILGDPALALLY
jgi:2-oxoisovalerate dehydrogenase E2 component (dihydrolipoyl transacylase)